MELFSPLGASGATGKEAGSQASHFPLPPYFLKQNPTLPTCFFCDEAAKPKPIQQFNMSYLPAGRVWMSLHQV